MTANERMKDLERQIAARILAEVGDSVSRHADLLKRIADASPAPAPKLTLTDKIKGLFR